MDVAQKVIVNSAKTIRLNDDRLLAAVKELTKIDADFLNIYEKYGPPPLWYRPPGFSTLVYIILEQQVSLASARAAYLKLQDAVPEIEPDEFLKLSDDQLKKIGFSRQKMAYCRGLATAIKSRELDLSQLENFTVDQVREKLMALKGIGIWTANIYLMEALLHPDIWPSNDLALMIALKSVKKLKPRPTVEEMESFGDKWKPWRAVAARLLWHDYLSRKNERIGI